MRKKPMFIAAIVLTVLISVFVFAACDEKITTTYNVKLDTGGEELQTISGVTVLDKAPDAPTKEGYRFEGWYLDAAYTQEPSYPLTLTSDITLYAKWTRFYSVSFQVNGGSEIETLTTDVIESSPRTYKDGFVFAGWYTNPRLTGSQVKFPYTPTKDVTLYAKWTEDAASEEFVEESTYMSTSLAIKQIKQYFAAMNGTALDFDSLMTTSAGTARIQIQANTAEGESVEFMFRISMQEDEKVAFAVYAANGEVYLDFGNGEAYVRLDDFRADYLYAILQKAGAEIDLEDLLSNLGGINVYEMLLSMIFTTPSYTTVTRVATGEVVSESFLSEINVNSMISGIKGILDLFDVGSLIGIDLNLNSLFNWLDSAIPQIRMYMQVDCENGVVTNMSVSVADNEGGTEGDELLDWKVTKIGYYNYPIYIDMPTDLEDKSKEFSFSNIAFDIDLDIDAPEQGLDVAKLVSLFTDKQIIPENTLIVEGQFGFRLKARVDLDLNYKNASVDNNLIALDLYVLDADGNPASDTPVLGIYYRDGAFYFSLSDMIPDYWKADNIKIEANLDALISDIVKLITTAIDDALGTDFDEAQSLSLSVGNVYNATLLDDGGEVKAIISPTISGLITAVAGVIGLQENVYVDADGDSIIIDVNQKFFDAINGFMPDNAIVLPEGLSNMSLSVNFADYGVKDIVASVDLGDKNAPLEARLRAHNFRIGYLEGELENLEDYILSRTEQGNYTSNLGELIYSVLSGVEINAHGSVAIDEGDYAFGKVLKGFGLDTGKDNPIIGIKGNFTDGDGNNVYKLDIDMLAAFAIDRENPEASKIAIELNANGNTLLAIYGYYENGISTVLLDLSGIKTDYIGLPIYKFEFDFANLIVELIDNINIDGTKLTDFDLAFDLGGLVGGSENAESLILAESDGTAGGTELTEAGQIILGLSADKITASVAFAAIVKILESAGVDTGISTDALDLTADLSLSTSGVSLGVKGTLPKTTAYDSQNGAQLPNEYGDYSITLETGTEQYPLTVGETSNLDAAVERGKQKAADAEDNLFDIVFGLANSMQTSITLNLSNEKGEIDVASIINNILAKEGNYIGFPINLTFDKNDADLYLDMMWDINTTDFTETKIYLELRYEQKKIMSFGIQGGILYVDLEGVGLFEFYVKNSQLATSLFSMIEEKVSALKDIDIGALLTQLITGASGASEDGATGDNSGSDGSSDGTMAILAAVLGDISIYDGVIKANIAASTFETIFKELLGSSLGVDIEVNNGEIDIERGIINLPITVNDVFSLNAKLELKPSSEFDVTNDSGKDLDATDGEAMARSLLKCLNMDFNLDIKNNNVEGLSYLRVRIKNVVEGTHAIEGDSTVINPETLVISVYLIDNEDIFNNTLSGNGEAILHVTLDYSDDALGADGTGKNMKIILADGKFEILNVVDLKSIVGSMLEFQMDIVGMLSGAMQSIIDALVFTEDGVEVDIPSLDVSAEESGEGTGESTDESTDPFSDLDINELLSGGINISLLSTGTFNINAGLDPYAFNKLIDDILGGMVFGENSILDLREMNPDMFTDHYLSHVTWDRVNPQVFWQSLKTQLVNLIHAVAADYSFLLNMFSGEVDKLLEGAVFDVVSALLPLPIYNEVNVGLNIVDGTLANIYVNGYDRNEAVVNEDGEVLTYTYGSTTLTYGANMRRNTYLTEINLYDCFDSVGDPDNTVDGSGNAGIINWGSMEFDMTFEPLAYEDDVITSDYEFIQEYFVGKTAVYQQGTTVMKAPVKFYLWNEETQSYGEEITLDTSLGLLDYANNENFESVTLTGKAEVTFPNEVKRERTFTITVQPNLDPALIDTVTMHAYDNAPNVLSVYFANRTYRIVEVAAIKSMDLPSPTIEGGTYEVQITFRNGKTATLNIEYLDSTITTLGSNGESGIYELDLYAFDETLDIMSQLPTQLFFSYSDGKYGAIDVESWAVDAEVLQAFASRKPDDLSGFEFKAIATVGKGDLVQNLELTVRIKGKEVTSLTIDGNENTVEVNPYDYYLYAIAAAEGTTFSPWPTTVDANYMYNGSTWSEEVKVAFSTQFDFSTMSFNAPGQYGATATLAGSEYFTWSREVTLDIQSNVIEGVYFDRALRRNTVTVDPLAFNNMTAEEKAALFPSTAWVKFVNGYVIALPIRWTDRNGYAISFDTLTFDASNYNVTMYAEIGYSDDAALNKAFYQRCAMTVKVNGAIDYIGEGVTVDPFGEAGAAQFPATITVGNGTTSFEANVSDWNVSGVDFSAKGGEYLAAASFVYNNKTYTVTVPVTVTAKEPTGFAEIEGDVYATYDETANTVTVEINGTGYEVVATPTANATLTVKFSDGSSASLETALDFSAVRPDADTVYYDSSLGTTAEEQGATAFSATATVYDAAGNAYSIEIRIYMSIINRIQTEPPVEPEIPETDETPSDGENA